MGEEEGGWPSPYIEGNNEYITMDAHWVGWQDGLTWLYNKTDKLYYNLKKNSFFKYSKKKEQFFDPDKESQEDSDSESDLVEEEKEIEDKQGEDREVFSGEESEGRESEDFLIDFETDIEHGVSEISDCFRDSKLENEDRHIAKQRLQLDLFAGSGAADDRNSEEIGYCVMSAVMDGHGGSTCADYTVAHLPNNFLSNFRQLLSKRELQLRRQKGKAANSRARNGGAEESDESQELWSLRKAMAKAFENTNQNYLSIAERTKSMDGCTALVAVLFGPDSSDGCLKLILGHVGDCRAVLFRDSCAVRLTSDHKPESELERERIEGEGGTIIQLKDIWRVTTMIQGRVFGLSTSRSLGDIHLKKPKNLVSAIPDIKVVTVDFLDDQFLILATDGIWDVVSDDEACRLVADALLKDKSAKKAAQKLTEEAQKRGSLDDKTVVVIWFKWDRSQLLNEQPEQEESGS